MPTYEIEFEQAGKTMVLEVEGAAPPTPEQATGLIQQHLSQGQAQQAQAPPPLPVAGGLPAPVPPAAPAPTGPETSLGPMAFGAVQGAADFLGSALELPKMAVEAGLKYLPESVRAPIRAMTYGEESVSLPPISKDLQRGAKTLLNKVGIPDQSLDADTRTEQFIQRVVRETTGTLVGLPAIRALSAGARAVPLATQIGREAAMGTAQGIGAAAAQQMAPGNAAAEIAGQLAPNAAAMVSSLARQLGTNLVPDVSTLRTQVARALSETAGDLDANNLDTALDVKRSLPGFNPTFAEATRNPGLLTLQASQGTNNPRLKGELLTRRNQNIDLMTDELDNLFKGGDPQDVQRSLGQTKARVEARLANRRETAQGRVAAVQLTEEQRLKRAQARINDRLVRANSDVKEATTGLVPGRLRPEERGPQAIDMQEVASLRARNLYEDARKTFRTESRRYYENIDPEEAVTGRVGELYDQAEEIAQRGALDFDQRDLPASLRDFQRSIAARAGAPVRPASAPRQAPLSSTPDDQLELQQFIRRHGGINLTNETDVAGEFEALIRNKEAGTTGLFKKEGGLTPAQMAERVNEAGFTFEADKFELLDAIRESVKTNKTYSSRNVTALGDPIDAGYLSADPTAINPTDLRDVDVSLTDLQKLRSHILRDARAQVGPEAANKRRLLNQFRNSVETRMEGLAREQGRPDVMENLKTANNFYRQNIRKFSTGAGEKILRQKNGVNGVSNANVIREFLKTPEDAAQFVDGIGNRGAALDTIETYLDAELYLKAVDPASGRLSTQAANKFLIDRRPMMRLFPELQERYSNIGALENKARRVEDAAGRISKRATRRIEESEELLDAQERAAMVEASVKQRAARLAQEPGNAILQDTLNNGGLAQIMGRPDSNHHLIRLADTMRNNPEAKTGLARGMWTEFLRREVQRTGLNPITDSPVLHEKQFSQFLDKYSSTINHIYGAEHMSNLRKVAKGLQLSRLADRPPGEMGSPTASLQKSMPSYLKLAQGATVPFKIPGQGVSFRLVRAIGGRVGHWFAAMREDGLRQITEEMLYDPDISKTFALLMNAKTARKAAPRLKAHMLMLGAENRFDDPEKEE